MNTYIPALPYPRTVPINLLEEERCSFDINDRNQVAIFIQDAIEEICRRMKEQPDPSELRNFGLIIEGMLDDDFGINLADLPYRDFVMSYIIDEDNWSKAKTKHECRVFAVTAFVESERR